MSQCAPSNRLNQYLPAPLAEVDSLLNHFFVPGSRANLQRNGWHAPAALYETEDQLHVEIDAPGVTSDDIEVTVENGQLSVTLERKRAEEAPTYVYNERRFGSVTRSLDLPDTVDPDSVEAELTAGVLNVSITKRPETQPRKIEVRQK